MVSQFNIVAVTAVPFEIIYLTVVSKKVRASSIVKICLACDM
jgi:hypothetical protein